MSASTPRIVLTLASGMSWLAVGNNTAGSNNTSLADTSVSFARVLLPAFVLAVPLIALFLAQVREGERAALEKDFVLVARAKGLRERDILIRHALRAALGPLIRLLFLIIGAPLVSESVGRRSMWDADRL